MTLVPGIQALLSLHKAPLRQFSLYATSPLSRLTSRMLCTTKQNVSDAKPEQNVSDAKPEQNVSDAKPEVQKENESLLESLTLMGVDVNMVRQRQPRVLRRTTTNEQGVLEFFESKGASRTLVADLIVRFPYAIIRSEEVLEQRWKLWHSILESDSEILRILHRSPDCFFRPSDNDDMEKNILFLSSRGLNTKLLAKRAPRIFSHGVELSREMVMFLEDVCAELGAEDPESFANAVITKHCHILTRSIKRVKTNLDFLRVSLKLRDLELLDFLRGSGVEALDISTDFLKNNFNLGCRRGDIRTMLRNYPEALTVVADSFNAKLDCLLEGGITVEQFIKKPRVLEYSTQNITGRLEELHRIGFDFEKHGIAILDSSQIRFNARLERIKKDETRAA